MRKLTAKAGGKSPARMLKEEVDEEDIAKVVCRWTGIPVAKMLEGEMKKLVQMEDRLRQRVIGQDDALARWRTRFAARARASAIRRSPIGSFIFLGPTGVGKTETRSCPRRVSVRRRARHGAHRHVASIWRSTRWRG